ncbi:thioredoxin-disulfide reductase [Candidatus Termititenax persephonae]|uniref:Thioredoxin-disulfide reductase n=1 Tax=Candidatus Termititenax persephonae TaxID=2218525 RepID=A0A388TIE0_9BACT|nr:thioredoxin-disulfide reductase [Candidatus Termititenax persephonae]
MQTQAATEKQKTGEPGGLFDTLIIGGGFAGLTAAIYAGRAGLDTLVLEPQVPGGVITTSELVENWPTQISISGLDLGLLLQKQVEKIGVKIEYGIASKINKLENIFVTSLDGGRIIQSRTVIYAAGALPQRINIPGEQEFRGRGVSYCATCDGPFYKQKNVVVIGGKSTAVQEALYLSGLAKTVTVVHSGKNLQAPQALLDKAQGAPNIIFKTLCQAQAICGEGKTLTGVVLQNLLTKTTETLSCDGVFVYAGLIPNTEMLKDFVRLAEDGYIAAGEDTRTNIAGFFAAGDTRQKDLRQLVTAAADGAVAATMAERYLQEWQI